MLARYVDYGATDERWVPGDWTYRHVKVNGVSSTRLLVCLPNGDNAMLDQRWKIVNDNPLTISPSINSMGNNPWHGFITNGHFIECGN